MEFSTEDYHELWNCVIVQICSVTYTKMSVYIPFYLIADLIAKEFIQVLQFLWVGDFTIQRRIWLHHSCSAADSNSGVSFDPLTVMVLAVVRLWSVSGQGDCIQTTASHYNKSDSKV